MIRSAHMVAINDVLTLPTELGDIALGRYITQTAASTHLQAWSCPPQDLHNYSIPAERRWHGSFYRRGMAPRNQRA